MRAEPSSVREGGAGGIERPMRPRIETQDRVLETDEVHGGVTIPAGSRVTDGVASKALHYWWPARDVTVDGVTVLAGSQLDPPQNGHLRALWSKRGQRVHDLVIDEDGVWIIFDEAGRLDTIMFRQPTLVRGLLVQHHVQFHPAPGAPLKKALLLEPAVIRGVAVGKGPVELDLDGTPLRKR
jgi:hypothetical protein